jgi:hypothetical protein
MKMKIRSYVVFCLAVSLSLVSGTAIAQQISDNWNTEACSFTDHAGFELQERTRLTSIELWYHWGRRESEVGYALFHEGEPVKRGRLMRGACDINQEAWCQARGNVGVVLPRGFVEVRTARGRVCQNAGSGGKGFIKAFGTPR